MKRIGSECLLALHLLAHLSFRMPFCCDSLPRNGRPIMFGYQAGGQCSLASKFPPLIATRTVISAYVSCIKRSWKLVDCFLDGCMQRAVILGEFLLYLRPPWYTPNRRPPMITADDLAIRRPCSVPNRP
jgi:hypothetical protein